MSKDLKVKRSGIIGILTVVVAVGAATSWNHIIGQVVSGKPGGVPLADIEIAKDPRVTPTVLAVNTAMPSVVNISTEKVVLRRDRMDELYMDFYGRIWGIPATEKTHSLGSGVIIDQDGYIITNYHVIERASRIRATTAGNGDVYEASLVAIMPETDLALLKIEPPAPDFEFPAIEFEGADDLILGEEVMTLGNPYGLGGSVSRGILSSKNRRQIPSSDHLEVDDWLQTDAAINLGNSGGPLINIKGRLIGINVATFSEGENIGFAIPIRRVMETIAYIFSPEKIAATWVGIQLDPVSREPVVLAVENDSPAKKAGFQTGDRIIQVNGIPIRNLFDIQKRLTLARPRSRLQITVERAESTREILTLEPIPLGDYFNSQYLRQRTGLDLEITKLKDTRSNQNITLFHINSIEPDSPAVGTNLFPGDLILQINDNNFESLEDLGWWLSYFGADMEMKLLMYRQVVNRFGVKEPQPYRETLVLR